MGRGRKGKRQERKGGRGGEGERRLADGGKWRGGVRGRHRRGRKVEKIGEGGKGKNLGLGKRKR